MSVKVDPQYLEHQRRLAAELARQPLVSIPNFPRIESYRPDGKLLRGLRVATYITVMVTCLVIIAAIVDVYSFLNEVGDALDNFSNNITAAGFLD